MVCLENNLKRTRNTQAEQETFQAGRLAGSQLWRGKGFGMWKREKKGLQRRRERCGEGRVLVLGIRWRGRGRDLGNRCESGLMTDALVGERGPRATLSRVVPTHREEGTFSLPIKFQW